MSDLHSSIGFDSRCSSADSTYDRTEDDESNSGDMAQVTPEEFEAAGLLELHLSFLQVGNNQDKQEEVMTCPIFNMLVLQHFERGRSIWSEPVFPQYGLLAGTIDPPFRSSSIGMAGSSLSTNTDPRIFFNIAAPSSTFICGSQGSGKSHTLSCLLENCLIPSEVSKLPLPLEGLVFHYDTFIGDHGGQPCEAAFLASNPQVKVRVLCSPTNFRTMQRTYAALKVHVEPLQIDERHLNTQRMLDLMAVSTEDGPVPIYLHTIYRILREMRMMQQETGTAFNYVEFKRQVMASGLTPMQLGPLNQRLETLESFMPKSQMREVKMTELSRNKGKLKKTESRNGNDWTPQPGVLTVVDLSCPCVTPESACSLFNICLSIFLEQSATTGRIIALDEAHKFMNTSPDAQTLTSTLLSTIRLQRHLGARIVISTQEPTVNPALLDLSSVTIVHRFTSPEWLRTLKGHLAPAASDLLDENDSSSNINRGSGGEAKGKTSIIKKIFTDIVNLHVGEALLFSPSAAIGMKTKGNGEMGIQRLGVKYLKIRVRSRLTADGGKSIMAS